MFVAAAYLERIWGGALAFCNSNGLFQPDDLICGAPAPDGALGTRPAPKSAGFWWRLTRPLT